MAGKEENGTIQTIHARCSLLDVPTEEKKKALKKEPKQWSYYENVLPDEKGYELYKQLIKLVQDDVKIHAQSKVFGKAQPRLVVYFSKAQSVEAYKYSGATQVNRGWPDVIQYLADIAFQLTGQHSDSGLVNWYRNGSDCIGAHRDKDAMEGHVISFSFYEHKDANARRFIVRRHKERSKIEVDIPLQHCSLFVMHPGMQSTFVHEIPRQKDIKDGRINVTLRMHQSGGTGVQKEESGTKKKRKEKKKTRATNNQTRTKQS